MSESKPIEMSNDKIEIHDSEILSFAHEGKYLCLSLDAYVHHWEMVNSTWIGSGWVRPVRIIITDGSCSIIPEIPADLDDGILRVGELTYNNLIPLPSTFTTPVTLYLTLMRTGEELIITGRDIAIESTGPGRWVEELPDEFSPSNSN